jgi:adenylylsulfate kinase-like enzyme
MRRQKLVFITGAPSIGKTTTGELLLKKINNSAFLDGDWLWHVNPFSLEDKRLRNGDKAMSFALDIYLRSDFEVVIFSSVILVDRDIRQSIIRDISSKEYELFCFHLKASKGSLKKRHENHGDGTEPAYDWLNIEPQDDDICINTNNKDPESVVEEIIRWIGQTNSIVKSKTSIKLFTDDLVLRTVTQIDKNEVMMKMNIDGNTISEQDALKEIDWMEGNHKDLYSENWKHLCLAIVSQEDRQIIGWCGLDNRNKQYDSPAIFYL